MTENEAIARIRYRIDTATHNIGKGADGRAYEDMEIAIKVLEEIQQYRVIGTVEECKVARERQKGKKPVYRSIFTDGTRLLGCPVCFSRIDGGAFYCNGCGQKLDWSDTP